MTDYETRNVNSHVTCSHDSPVRTNWTSTAFRDISVDPHQGSLIKTENVAILLSDFGSSTTLLVRKACSAE